MTLPRDQLNVSATGVLSVEEVATFDTTEIVNGILTVTTRVAPDVDRTFVTADGRLTVVEGVGGSIISSIFADGTDGFYFDFSKTDRLFQNRTGATLADGAGENIALALDAHALDGRGPVNKLIYTQQFDNAAWTKAQATVTANSSVAPDGTTTADTLLDTAANNIHHINQTVTGTPSGLTYTVSAYLKASALNYATIGLSDISSGSLYAVAVFNLSSGALATSGAAGAGYSVTSSGITSVGNGWYRCAVTVVAGTSVSFLKAVVGANKTGVITGSAGGFETYLGDGSGVFVWGAQLEEGASASAYQPNGASVGGPGNHGLQATTAAQPKWQTGGLARLDRSDDALRTTLLPSNTAMTLIAKVKPGATAANRMAIGSNAGGTARCFLGFDTGGLVVGGVGTDSLSTIKGSTNRNGAVSVIALVADTGVKLYEQGVQTYSGAKNGSINTTQAFDVGGVNADGTSSLFFENDVYFALAIQKALTAAEIAAITNLWGTS